MELKAMLQKSEAHLQGIVKAFTEKKTKIEARNRKMAALLKRASEALESLPPRLTTNMPPSRVPAAGKRKRTQVVEHEDELADSASSDNDNNSKPLAPVLRVPKHGSSARTPTYVLLQVPEQ
jgi:hypothetical protein